ncbi:unnamed protein product [Phaeothamnion confervicola]
MGELIGSGSFGRVYKAMNRRTGEEFAVKEVGFDASMSERDVECLAREIEVMRQLCHENIVRYLGYEVRHRDGQLFIFQEWVPGNSLSTCLQTYGRFSDSVTRRYTRQVLKGLSYLHSHGVVHMDIKCENLLLDKGGVVKLADFGTAEWIVGSGAVGSGSGAVGASGGTPVRWGTPLYMAPEVLTQRHYSPKADVWAVGGAILQMATLSPPWAGKNFKTPVQLARHMCATRASPDIPSWVAEPLMAIMRRCFEWEVADRPTAVQLLADENLAEEDSDSDEAFWKAAEAPGAVRDEIKRTMYSEVFSMARRAGGATAGASQALRRTNSGLSAAVAVAAATGAGAGSSGATVAAGAGGMLVAAHKHRTRRNKSRSMDDSLHTAVLRAAVAAAAKTGVDASSGQQPLPPPPPSRLHAASAAGAALPTAAVPCGDGRDVPHVTGSGCADNPFSRPRRPRLTRLLVPESPTSSAPPTCSPNAGCQLLLAHADTPSDTVPSGFGGRRSFGALPSRAWEDVADVLVAVEPPAFAPLAAAAAALAAAGAGARAQAARRAEAFDVVADAVPQPPPAEVDNRAEARETSSHGHLRHRARRHTLPLRRGGPDGGGSSSCVGSAADDEDDDAAAVAEFFGTATGAGADALAGAAALRAGSASGSSRRRIHRNGSSGTTTAEPRSDSGSASLLSASVRQQTGTAGLKSGGSSGSSGASALADSSQQAAAFADGLASEKTDTSDGSGAQTTSGGSNGGSNCGSNAGAQAVVLGGCGDDGVSHDGESRHCHTSGATDGDSTAPPAIYRPRRLSRPALAVAASEAQTLAPAWQSPSPEGGIRAMARAAAAAVKAAPTRPVTTDALTACGVDGGGGRQSNLRRIIGRSRRGSFAPEAVLDVAVVAAGGVSPSLRQEALR